MPWSCLCSSEKEKHKLQISAPILNRNDKRNVKIIQNSSNIRKEETINPDYQRNVNEISSVSSKNYPDDDKLRLKSSLKKKERLKKNDKNAKDSQALLYGGKEQSPKPAANVKFSTCTVDLNSNVSSSSPYRVEPEDEDSTYSQLVFECKTNKSNDPSAVIVFPPNSVNTSASNPPNDAVRVKDPNTGHYDVLPFDKSPKQNVSVDIDLKNANVNDKGVGQQWSATKSHGQPFYQMTSTSTVTGGDVYSGDVIPFIDEDDTLSSIERHAAQQRIHEGNDSGYTNKSRIITLHPLNVGSSQTIQRGDSLFRTHLSNLSISNKSDMSALQPQPQQQTHVAMNLKKKINESVEIRQGSPQTSATATATTNPIGVGRTVGVHEFFSWNSTKGKLCQICHASTLNGSNMLKCRGCGLVCHIWCVPTITKSNEDRIDSSQQIVPKLETQPLSIQSQPPLSQHPKATSTPSLRLHYVTERVLAYILPSQNGNHLDDHNQYEREVIPMLEQKHGKNFQLFNLEKYISIITLERICELCKHIDKWLGSGQEKVVVLQDREDCQRLCATIIAFLEYLQICASNYQTRANSTNEDAQAQSTITRNWMNLDMFSMKKFLESNVGPLRIPSYKRYIRYFSGLLSGQIKLNSSALHLNYVSIESPPSWLQYNGLSSNGEWNSFIKIYEGLQCVYTSDIHIIPITTRQFLYQVGNLRLRGDILIRCYQISPSDDGYNRETRKLLFSVQFHTCAIKTDNVVFGKEDLDVAFDDPRFPSECKVSFHFSSGANNNFLFQSPLIRTELAHDLAKANSIEHLDLRPTLTSSVSPSSFPSQVSPQEDRHRELDDILSDMLLTVQNIPDFQNRKSSTHSINQYGRSQSVVSHVSGTASAPSPVYTLPITNPPAHNTNRELVHGTHSYVSRENVQRHTNSHPYKQDRFDPYDTASTTTTLTPPPSESGRDTPNLFTGYHSSTSNMSFVQPRQQQQPSRRETTGTMSLQHNQVNPRSPRTNSQHQSTIYQQVVRSSSGNRYPIIANASEDEENIPYHAREYSQPFTYGNLPSNGVHLNEVLDPDNQPKDPRMIKAQSGLTSPMLVRKTFGGNTIGGGGSSETAMYSTLRKTPTRNDFEEMLRERREKVMSEKYSISDKQPIATNGYHNYYSDPLKRSNTLDGFHRSNSNTELSGQTWLQLQQQKLRAKKNQQLRDDRKYFDEIHTEIKNRSLRSRNIRQDGYASDTAAFDEVDYRRPLHVQTPYHTTNSSPERHYHTINTTTKTVTKERPFVAVRRSHETAKQEKLGSPSLSPLAILNASPLGHIAQAQPSNNIRNSDINNINSNNQNGLLSLADSPSSNGRTRLVREESFSSFRSEIDQDISVAGSPRPETPAFPVTPRTPYGLNNGSTSPGIPPRSPTPQRRDIYSGAQKGLFQEISNQNETIYRNRMNSNSSNVNSEPQEVDAHLVKFVRDSSKFWYKPNISREEAIHLLRNATPGSFIVRDSTTFKNSYGLVVRVAQPPPGVTASPGSNELVRHFLVEPTTRGVRLKGCANEPVFTSLSALVYQHSITPLALPCRLIIPDSDIQQVEVHTPAQKQLLTQGAACNVLYLYSCGTESLTGEEAVRRAVAQLFSIVPLPKPTEVHFKVTQQGITLTDNTRQKFFRKHYPAHNISFCGIDPEHRQWSVKTEEGNLPVSNKTIFAFVARRSPSSKDNQCHVFCELAVSQPATAIVPFANKVLPTERQINRNI